MFVPKDYSWDSEEGWPSASTSGLVSQDGFQEDKAGGLTESGDLSLRGLERLEKRIMRFLRISLCTQVLIHLIVHWIIKIIYFFLLVLY